MQQSTSIDPLPAASQKSSTPRTIIIGHKNPDTDSVAAATALAHFKTLKGKRNIIPACAGVPGERTAYIFNKFGVPLPPVILDVSPTVKDLMLTDPASVPHHSPLLKTAQIMQERRQDRLPIVDGEGKYLGMISLFDLAGSFFQCSANFDLDGAGDGLFGREVKTSISLVTKALHAKILTDSADNDALVNYSVFVGAMGKENFNKRVGQSDPARTALVVGDRDWVLRNAIERGLALLIITGNQVIHPDILHMARDKGVALMQTAFDSATAVRRLKFSSPVEISLQKEAITFTTKDRLRDVKYLLRQSREDIFPVVNNEGLLVGTLSKFQLDEDPPVRLILVDHNEMIQAVDGADEVPIVEIVDHHRVSIGPTTNPITITCDVVGSTCTLITEMYQRHDLTPPPDIAGVLLGGVVTDTLMLRSPTSTVRDRHAITYLEEISVVSGADLLRETLNVGSVIASMSPADALKADRKEYATSKCKFTVAQVEESSYDNFYAKRDDLLTELEASLEQLGIDLACLLVTDVIIEDSLLLVAGHKYLLNTIPYKPLDEHLFSLPRVLSRKKQLLPDLLKVFE